MDRPTIAPQIPRTGTGRDRTVHRALAQAGSIPAIGDASKIFHTEYHVFYCTPPAHAGAEPA